MTHRIMVRGSVSPFLYIWLKGKLSKNGTEGILVKKKKEREREKNTKEVWYMWLCYRKSEAKNIPMEKNRRTSILRVVKLAKTEK